MEIKCENCNRTLLDFHSRAATQIAMRCICGAKLMYHCKNGSTKTRGLVKTRLSEAKTDKEKLIVLVSEKRDIEIQIEALRLKYEAISSHHAKIASAMMQSQMTEAQVKEFCRVNNMTIDEVLEMVLKYVNK